jgi:hypothetical protein
MHFRVVFVNIPQPLQTLLLAKHGHFVDVSANTDYQSIKQWQSPVYNICVTKGNRVKRTGKQTYSLHFYILSWGVVFSKC